MRGHSSKSWVQRGRSAAGRSAGSSSLGMNQSGYQRARQYDAMRKDAMLELSNVIFARFPALTRTGQMTGQEVKYLQFFYPIGDVLRCKIELSNGVLMPGFSGQANEIAALIELLIGEHPELKSKFKVREPGIRPDVDISELGSMMIQLSGTFDTVDFWAPLLSSLEAKIASQKAA